MKKSITRTFYSCVDTLFQRKEMAVNVRTNVLNFVANLADNAQMRVALHEKQKSLAIEDVSTLGASVSGGILLTCEGKMLQNV